MLNVRCYKDGDALVLYFDKCSPAVEELVKGLIQPIMASEARVEAVEEEQKDIVIPNIYYTDPETKKPVLSDMSGKTVKQYLDEDGDRAYGNIKWILNKGKFGDDKETVNRILAQWLVDKFYGINPTEYAAGLSAEEIELFLKSYSSLLTADMKNIIKNISGTVDFDTFLQEAEKEKKMSLVMAIIQNIQGIQEK